MFQDQPLRNVKQRPQLLKSWCSCAQPNFQCNWAQNELTLSSFLTNNPEINTSVFSLSTSASSERFNFSRRLSQDIDSRRFACCGRPTLSLQAGFQHLAPVSRHSLNAHTYHSAQVCLCSFDTDHLFAALENSLLVSGLCLAQVSLCSLKQNSGPNP